MTYMLCLIFKPTLQGKDQYLHYTNKKMKFRKFKTSVKTYTVSSRDDANITSSKPKQKQPHIPSVYNTA